MSESIMHEYGLPDLPEPAEEGWSGTATLVLFRFREENIPLGNGDVFILADAKDYCERDDTRGDGWFAGWRHAN